MSSNYQMWMTGNGSTVKLRIPVLPETIEVTRGSNNENVKLTGVGDVTVVQAPAADKVRWKCFFPAASFPGVQGSPSAPLRYVRQIMAWKDSKQPVFFVSTALGISDYYTIETFDCAENGGDVGTIHYTIALKLYRTVSSRVVMVDMEEQKATVSQSETAPRVDNTETPATYTVVSGDTLYNIARRLYGDGSLYPKIFDANRDKISNPNLIHPGQVLTIPE